MAAARARPPPLPGGWTVDSAFRPPAELTEVLLSSDAAAATRYLPDWREFPHPALNLGVVHPGELRSLRIVLRNRGAYAMSIRVDTSGAEEHLTAAFSEQPLPPGVPRVMDIDARFTHPGEYTGEVRIYSRVKQEGEQRVNAIPFYALVPGSDPEARFPRVKSEQKEMSVKGLPYTHSGSSGIKLVNASPRASYDGGSVASAAIKGL